MKTTTRRIRRHKRDLQPVWVMGIFHGYNVKPLCFDAPAVRFVQYYDFYPLSTSATRCSKCMKLEAK